MSSKFVTIVTLPALAQAPQVANPFFQEWRTPFQVPPFNQINSEHFLPAFHEGFVRQAANVDAILNNPTAPNFANTIEAFDISDEFLARVKSVFFNLVSAEANDSLMEVNNRVSSLLAAHTDDLLQNSALFKRVKVVFDAREHLGLGPEQRMLLERTYSRFIRGGASLSVVKQARLRVINHELADLPVKFGKNLLRANNVYRMIVDRKENLTGLSESQIIAAAEAAKADGLEGKWVFTLKAPSLFPFLENASNRELRKKILTAYISRCDGGEDDNKAIFARIASLRAEKAQLLGYATWADFQLVENMAKNPTNAYRLQEQVWKPALELAKKERAELQSRMDKDYPGQKLEIWDWRYYETQVRKAKYDLDEAAIRPYFPLERVRNGAFEVATKLYGVTFTERTDLPVYHPEVKTFEVKEKDGKHLGILYVDYHPRQGKQGGAWCNYLVEQRVVNGKDIRPVVINVGNFSRPSGEIPALLSADEVRTLFHEFGHAIHCLVSMVRYHGSHDVATDFVEMPSQLMENWAFEPEVLKLYARHYKTADLIPKILVDKLQKASKFGQGFATTEYLAAALMDMDWHTLTDTRLQDVASFEKASMARWGLVPEILPRYRTSYFIHIATTYSENYSAGYYSYIWSAVLDSDAFRAFKEQGDLFDSSTAKAFRTLLSKGGGEDPQILYRTFRGRDPKVEALLEKRGMK